MASTDTVRILVTLRDAASKGLAKIGNVIGGVRSKLGSLASGLTGIRGLLAGVGAGLLARSFVQAGDAAEQYRVRLNVLLGSQRESNKLFEEAAKFASSVSFEYEEIMGAATQLAGIAKGGADEITGLLPLISDLAATSGLGIEETTNQIIRMFSAGAASADLFRERGILAMLGFQAGVSYSAEETRKKVIEAFEDPGSKFRGAAQDLATTWSGLFSMLADRWFQFRLQVTGSGVFEFFKAGIQLMLDYIERLRKGGDLAIWAKNISDGVIVAFQIIAQGIGWVGDAWRGWQMIWDVLKIGFSYLVEGVIKGLASITDFIADVRNKMINLAKDAGRLAQTLKVIPGLKGYGKLIESVGQANYKIKASGEALRDNAKYWEQVRKEAKEHLSVVANEVPYHQRVKKILLEIERVAADNAAKAQARADKEKTRGNRAGADQALGIKDKIEAEVSRFSETTRTLLTKFDALYNQGAVGLGQYFNERKRILDEQFEYEKKRLQQLAKAETDPGKRAKIETDLFKLEQGHERELIKLEQDRVQAVKDRAAAQRDAASILADVASRAQAYDIGGVDLGTQFAEQQRALQEQQATEMEKYLELVKGSADAQVQIEKLKNAHILEEDKLLNNQRRQLIQYWVDVTTSTLGNAADAFKDFYTSTGKQHKEAFALYKAFAIAEAIISTIQSAQNAFASLSSTPYVGPALGAVAAAAAIAAGMARVAQIKAQELAEGGLVEGYSPHAKADNINAKLTAGEYVQPVDVVKHYGVAAMQAIRDKSIPKDILNGLVNPTQYIMRGGGHMRFADGGLVSKTPPAASAATVSGTDTGMQQPPKQQDIQIVNVPDPAMMGQYLQSTAGKKQIVNIIRSERFEVHQVLSEE